MRETKKAVVQNRLKSEERMEPSKPGPLNIVTEKTKNGCIVLKIDLPVHTDQIIDCLVNGKSVIKCNGLGVTEINLNINSKNALPTLVLKGVPLPPRLNDKAQDFKN